MNINYRLLYIPNTLLVKFFFASFKRDMIPYIMKFTI